MPEQSPPSQLQVFLCHSSADKPAVRDLYGRLRADGFRPWLDEEDIPGGVRWEHAIEDAVRASHIVVVLLTKASVNKEGFLQREIGSALKVAEEKPDEVIYIIPLKLEECDVPRRLSHLHWIDFFEEQGYNRLVRALTLRASQLGIAVQKPTTPSTADLRRLKEGKPLGIFEKAGEAADFVLKGTSLRPKIGIVLGSGLGFLADKLASRVALPFGEIPHFPEHDATPGYTGRLVVGKLNGIEIAALQGRFHLYEGGGLDAVAFPIRVFARMGIRALLLTGSAGSLNPAFGPGSLVVLSDHINLMGTNPHVGPRDERFESAFVDLSEVYSPRFRHLALEVGRETGVRLSEGVYVAHSGPTYETPAEIRALRSQGADLVGMSIVPEAIAARALGIEVLAVCVATAFAVGVKSEPITHQEVLTMAQQVPARFPQLLEMLIPKIATELG